jgi:hypothetical protein
MHLSSPPYVPHVLPISVILTWSPEWYLVRSTEHKALCYAVFSTPLLPHPSYAQISSSGTCSSLRISALSISKDFVLYKYLVLPMTDYAALFWGPSP